MFVVGSTVGESVIPVLIGLAIAQGGRIVLEISMVTTVGIIVVLYLAVDALVRFGCVAPGEVKDVRNPIPNDRSSKEDADVEVVVEDPGVELL